MENLIDISLVEDAEKAINESKLIIETPVLTCPAKLFELDEKISLFLKLENMQTNGSFKIRGVLNQFNNLKLENDKSAKKLITFSAGNYGKAFSVMCNKRNLKGKVVLPDSASESRIMFIQSQGVETEKVARNLLLESVDNHVKQGWELVHPLDDKFLIAGYAPMAKEILKVVDPDIVLVCCGGGSLLAGLSTGFAFYGSRAIIYGVEPENARSMKDCFENGYDHNKDRDYHSIATGLAPPIAGRIAYEHCKKYVKDILLVSDEEILKTCRILFDKGLKVEPSGCAALAALLFQKCPELNNFETTIEKDKLKIVVIVSGGNISAQEIANLF